MDTRVVMAFGAWGSATNMDYCHDIHTSKEGREGGGRINLEILQRNLKGGVSLGFGGQWEVATVI